MAEPSVDNENSSLETPTTNIILTHPILDSPVMIAIHASVLIFCAITGAVGNALIFLAVAVTPRLQTLVNSYIVNLAVSDFLVCVIVTPFTALTVIDKGWTLSTIGCYIIAYMNWIFISVSLYLLLLIALSRYCLVSKPHVTFRKYCRPSTVTFYIVYVWLSALLTVVMLHFCLKSGVKYDPIWGMCATDYNTPVMSVYAPVMSAVSLMICFVVIPAQYWLTFRAIRKSRLRVTGDDVPSSQSSQQGGLTRSISRKPYISKGEIRMTRISLIIFIIFVMCWAPLLIVYMLGNVFPKLLTGMRFCVLLLLSNSTINPYLYAWLNKNFRSAIVHVLTRGKRRVEPMTTDDNNNLPTRRMALDVLPKSSVRTQRL